MAARRGSRALHCREAAESLGREPRGELRRWARAVIDAGADAVMGHGPHVLRGIEFYRGRLIAYSLGNFLTYRGFNLAGPLGVTGVLQLEFAPDRWLRRGRGWCRCSSCPGGTRAGSRRAPRSSWCGGSRRRTSPRRGAGHRGRRPLPPNSAAP